MNFKILSLNLCQMLLGSTASALLVVSGCSNSDDWKANVFSTSGSISINGEPPDGALIAMHPLSGEFDTRGSQPFAVVDQQGKFVVSTYVDGDGAAIGDYKILVRWPSFRGSKDDRLKGVYWDPNGPSPTVSVVNGKNILSPIELTNVKVGPIKNPSNTPKPPDAKGVGRRP